jgi:prepilin-type N-terminal cleavage/methylation domain-containing protein
MKPLHAVRTGNTGFTLFELLISISIASALFAAVLSAGSFALKSLYVADDYSSESNEQLRAMDFLARDIRGALSFTIPTGGSSLTVTLPDYYTSYDSQGNPTGSPRNPVIASGAPGYGNTAQPLLVTYSVSGDKLLRQQTIQATGATSTLVVCSNVNSFQLNFTALSTSVKYSITFMPKLQTASTTLRTGTTLSGTVCARTMRFQSP